jgi:hypothetical protein
MLWRLGIMLVLPSTAMLGIILALHELETPLPWAISIAVAAWTWLVVLLWARAGSRNTLEKSPRAGRPAARRQ